MFTSNNAKLQGIADTSCWYVCNHMNDEALDEFESLCKLARQDDTLDMREVAALMHEMSASITRWLTLSWSQAERFAMIRWLADSVCPQSRMYA